MYWYCSNLQKIPWRYFERTTKDYFISSFHQLHLLAYLYVNWPIIYHNCHIVIDFLPNCHVLISVANLWMLIAVPLPSAISIDCILCIAKLLKWICLKHPLSVTIETRLWIKCYQFNERSMILKKFSFKYLFNIGTSIVIVNIKLNQIVLQLKSFNCKLNFVKLLL